MATQKETSAAGPDSRSKIVLLVDASQQTGKAVLSVCCLFTLTRAGRCVTSDVGQREAECPLSLAFLHTEAGLSLSLDRDAFASVSSWLVFGILPLPCELQTSSAIC